jgi:YHS domain-containing protein
MKTLINILFLTIICIQFSCSSNNEANENTRVIGSVPNADTLKPNRFANIHFASRFDTSCGMPLSAGLEDTLQYKGKIYGFCSKECKDEFITKLERGKKR